MTWKLGRRRIALLIAALITAGFVSHPGAAAAAGTSTTSTTAINATTCRIMLNQGKANLGLSAADRATIAKLSDTSCTLRTTNTVQRLAPTSAVTAAASATWCESVWTSASFYYGSLWFMTSHVNGSMCFNGSQVFAAPYSWGGWYECHEDMFPTYMSSTKWCGVWNNYGWHAQMGENYDYWQFAYPWGVTHFYVRTDVYGNGYIGHTYGGSL